MNILEITKEKHLENINIKLKGFLIMEKKIYTKFDLERLYKEYERATVHGREYINLMIMEVKLAIRKPNK